MCLQETHLLDVFFNSINLFVTRWSLTDCGF